MMPQNVFLTAQVLYKHPVFENDVATVHVSKKQASRHQRNNELQRKNMRKKSLLLKTKSS
jgi:hypothetical protein